jgi:hypothetical protein
MKLKLAIVFLLSLFAVGLHAQTPAIPPTQLFTFSGNLGGFNGSSATNGAVIATAALQILPTVSAGYEHLNISALNLRGEFGVIAYTRPLSAFLGKTIADKLLFDTTQIGVTISGGAGKILQPTANRVGETLGVHFSYPLTTNLSVQVIGIDVIHGAGKTLIISSNYSEAVSTGLNVHF